MSLQSTLNSRYVTVVLRMYFTQMGYHQKDFPSSSVIIGIDFLSRCNFQDLRST